MGTFGPLMGSLGQVFEQQSQAERQARAYREHVSMFRHTKPSARTQAAELLGVAEDAAPEDVKAAFHAKVKAMHTDTGGAGGDMDALKKARDLLLTSAPKKELLKQELTCPLCQGVGTVATGFGSTQCASCRGTGHVI